MARERDAGIKAAARAAASLVDDIEATLELGGGEEVPTLDDAVEWEKQRAEDIVAGGSPKAEVIPVTSFYSTSGAFPVVHPVGDEAKDELFVGFLPHLAEAVRARLFVTTYWGVKRPSGEMPQGSFEDVPGRREYVHVVASDGTRLVMTTRAYAEREKGEPPSWDGEWEVIFDGPALDKGAPAGRMVSPLVGSLFVMRAARAQRIIVCGHEREWWTPERLAAADSLFTFMGEGDGTHVGRLDLAEIMQADSRRLIEKSVLLELSVVDDDGNPRIRDEVLELAARSDLWELPIPELPSFD